MTAHEQAATATSADVLGAIHRRLAQIHGGLAEYGPTDPRMAVPWTLDELTTVMRYIRAVEKGEPAHLSD